VTFWLRLTSVQALEATTWALDTGQIEQVIEKNIFPAPADNNGTNAVSLKKLSASSVA
jgi:hypothetical protein